MKRYIPLLIISILAFQNFLLSQQLSGRFSTSAYTWERLDTVGRSNVITRLYQNVQLTASQGDISFQTYLLGAIGGAGSLSNDGQVRVSNAYLRWKNIGNILEVNLGRVPVFAGVGNGVVDGALLKAKLMDQKLFLTGYGGSNVLPNLRSKGFSEVDKNFFFGLQATGIFLSDGRLSVSYMNRQRSVDGYTAIRPDTAFNAISVNVQPDVRKEQIIGADARYDKFGIYSLYGRFDFDLNSNNVIRGEFNTHVDVFDKFAVTGTFIYREARIPYHSFFSVFENSSLEEYEGGVEYSFCPSLIGYGKFALVQYEEENSQRYTVGFNTKYGSCSYSGSNGYAGELNALSLQGVYPFFNRMLVPNAGISWSHYRLDSTTKLEDAIAASLGATVRPFEPFSFDVQVQWLRNKIVDKDVRVFCKISYWFSHNFSHSQEKGE